MLRASSVPIPIADIWQHLGQGQLPAELIYFKHGVVGLEQHFPDFDKHQRALVPPFCLRKIRSRPDRQWHSRELMEHLKGTVAEVPAWMTFWHLTALLRRASSVRYLGRHCFELAAQDVVQRHMLKDALLDLLTARSEPMKAQKIIAALSKSRHTNRGFVYATLARPPFIRDASGRWTILKTRA